MAEIIVHQYTLNNQSYDYQIYIEDYVADKGLQDRQILQDQAFH